MKYVFMGLGILCIVLFFYLLFVGVKIVSTVFLYIVGFLAVVSFIGFIIYFAGKISGRSQRKE